MKRKAAAILAAMLVFAMGSTTVFAAQSPATDNKTEDVSTATEVAAGQTVDTGTPVVIEKTAQQFAEDTKVDGADKEPAKDTDVADVAKTVEQLKNDVSKLGDMVGSEEVKAAATDSTKKVVATIRTVVELKMNDAAQKSIAANGYADVTLTIPELKDNANVMILHLNNGKWEKIERRGAVSNGKVTGRFWGSFSPVAVVEVAVEDAPAVAAAAGQPIYSPEYYEALKAQYGGVQTVAAAGGTGVGVTSPKTGEAVAVSSLLALVFLAGAVSLGKKAKAN